MAVVSKSFYLEVKKRLGITAMSEADWLLLCHVWQAAEGGTAMHNPFNCTKKMAGSTDYNSIGVQNYVSKEQGIEATVAMIKQANMADIYTAMKNNADPYYTGVMIGDSPWGTDIKEFVRVLALNYDYGAKR